MLKDVASDIFSVQGDAGEHYVASILGRHGFTVNQSSKDRYGWDLCIERTLGKRKETKLECFIQVKSTRLVGKNTIQIKLSALLNLIFSPSMCALAHVTFSGVDLHPKLIAFAHVDRDIVALAKVAQDEAKSAGVAAHSKWVTINTLSWTKLDFDRAESLDLSQLFTDYLSAFGGHYGLEKGEFVKRVFRSTSRKPKSQYKGDDSGGEIQFQNFASWRHSQSLTQDELATELGVHPQTIKKYERFTREPDIQMLLAMAAISEGVNPVTMVGQKKYARLAMAATSAGLAPVTLIDKKRKAKGEHVAVRGRPRRATLP
ncbi:helix-turn-helix domain-containing protein [Rhizobium laguerreae]|nr:helix-turn-helix domain-containing protein [Rhizobium laguerreae]